MVTNVGPQNPALLPTLGVDSFILSTSVCSAPALCLAPQVGYRDRWRKTSTLSRDLMVLSEDTGRASHQNKIAELLHPVSAVRVCWGRTSRWGGESVPKKGVRKRQRSQDPRKNSSW